jgi:asparagine synthase (glutamine-hydrolysing)
MCGIAGIVGAHAPGPADLRSMATAMAHRGPDSEQIWSANGAGLAFRRLAVIDLDARSDQPLHLEELHLVFNGEIYNYLELREELRGRGHRFSTEGDGEVLLHAWRQWGEGALDRLNGMFAFAVWDAAARVLTIACDPVGEKPLFWAQTPGRLLFASDIRALTAVAPELSAPRESALGPYLARAAMPPIEQSFFARVHRLPGGHRLTLRGGHAEVRRWWTPARREPPSRYADAVEELRALLIDSVRLRLRSDVPVGTSLSGGIDSSAIVGLSAPLSPRASRHAFTARFPGFARDEWRPAHLVARRAGVAEHHAVQPTGEELLDDLAALVLTHEEPVGSSSVYAQYRVMRAARQAGVTVLLDGQGADELFGGYRGIPGWALRDAGPRAMAAALLRGGSARSDLIVALGAEHLPAPLAARYRRRASSPYVSATLAAAAARVELPWVDWARDRRPLARELAREVTYTSMPTLLRYADRNSMAHSREVRLPFLDRRIIELAFSLPADFLCRRGVQKRILRDAIADRVPAEILAPRPKVGFETPEAQWLSQPRALALIGDRLLDHGARIGPFLDRRALTADVRAGRLRDPNGVWRLLNLELWLEAFPGTGGPGSSSPSAAAEATRWEVAQ